MDPSRPRNSNRRPPASGQTSAPSSGQTSAPQRALLPGPAGVVQAAMLQRTLDRQNISSQETPIATQEYIRRAIEDPEEDQDFERDPWISALEFLLANNMTPAISLKDIKLRCVDATRFDFVIAIVKTYTPNGLGDALVTLKDPTGTIAGSIHKKVLSASDFANDISVGSVLILEKVCVLKVERSKYYINITLPNVVKVFN